jgi:hypothetical protein
MDIVFAFPTGETPGFLRRQRVAVALQQELAKQPTVESIDKLVGFLAEFVKEPEDREEAKAAVWELPQEKIEEVLKKITETQTAPKSSATPATG